jgi:parallel beta-helix repeat protein
MIDGGKRAMRLKAWSLGLFAAAAMLAYAASAGAVDGIIEINQAKVLASGGSFPYTISAASAGQSYRLTGPLKVPASTEAILVSAPNVTIDLNGFTISGPGATNAFTPYGIDASAAASVNTTVENGTITGFARGLVMGNGVVRNVKANTNMVGIEVGTASVISGNTVNSNTEFGIVCDGAGDLISGNTVFQNGTGIACAATSGYAGNVLNNTNNISGGTNLGHNLCGSSLCP